MLDIKKLFKRIIDENFKYGDYGFCDFEVLIPYLNKKLIHKLPDNLKTVIVFIFPYYVDIEEHNISRYAVVKDYHKVCGDILNNIVIKLKEEFSDNIFKFLIDTSPIPEVLAASICDLGVIGKNNLLISPKYGSWIFIGEIVTDIKIPCKSEIKRKSCLNCGLCIKNCPTGALKNDNFNFQKCISYINQKKSDLDIQEIEIIKNSQIIWGCDICQEVCPMNKNILHTSIPDFNNYIEPIIKIGDYDKLEARAFQWRKKFVIERNLSIKLK